MDPEPRVGGGSGRRLKKKSDSHQFGGRSGQRLVSDVPVATLDDFI